MAFDPERKPRVPGGVESILRERESYFYPQIGEDEDGFSLRDAESLGWNVDLYHATKHYPNRGLIEIHAGRDVLDSNVGQYGVLKAVYEYELKEHQRAKARAREICKQLGQVLEQWFQASDASKAAWEEVRPRKDSEGEWVVLSDEEEAAQKAVRKRQSLEHRKAIQHMNQAIQYLNELGAFSRLELPEAFIEHLKETKPLDAARKGLVHGTSK